MFRGESKDRSIDEGNCQSYNIASLPGELNVKVQRKGLSKNIHNEGIAGHVKTSRKWLARLSGVSRHQLIEQGGLQ